MEFRFGRSLVLEAAKAKAASGDRKARAIYTFLVCLDDRPVDIDLETAIYLDLDAAVVASERQSEGGKTPEEVAALYDDQRSTDMEAGF